MPRIEPGAMGGKQEWYPCAMQPPSNASMFPLSANREFDRFETASHFFRFASLPFVLMLLPRQTYKWFREFIAKKNHETFSALIQETIFIGGCFRRNKSTLFNREREKNYQLLPNDNNSWIWKTESNFLEDLDELWRPLVIGWSPTFASSSY